MAAICSLRAGRLAQNLYRTHFSKATRLNYLYAALFHTSPPLDAGFFGFGEDHDGSFIDNFCEAHSHMIPLEKLQTTVKCRTKIEPHQKHEVKLEIKENDPIARPPHIDPIARPPHIDPIARPPHIDPIAGPPHIDPIARPPYIDPIAGPPHIDPIAGPPHIDPIARPPQIDPIAGPPHIDQPPPKLPMNQTTMSEDSVKGARRSEVLEQHMTEVERGHIEKSEAQPPKLPWIEAYEKRSSRTTPMWYELLLMESLQKVSVPEFLEYTVDDPGIDSEVLSDTHFQNEEHKYLNKGDASQLREPKNGFITETYLAEENITEKQSVTSLVNESAVDSEAITESVQLKMGAEAEHKELEKEEDSNILMDQSLLTRESENDLSGNRISKENESLKSSVDTPVVSDFVSHSTHYMDEAVVEGDRDGLNDHPVEQLLSMTELKASEGNEQVDLGFGILKESECVHHQPSLQPISSPQSVAELDSQATLSSSSKVVPEEEEMMQGPATEGSSQNDTNILNDSNVIHESEERKLKPFIVPLEAVIIPEPTSVDLASDHTQLQLENLTKISSAQEGKSSSDPHQDLIMNEKFLLAENRVSNHSIIEHESLKSSVDESATHLKNGEAQHLAVENDVSAFDVIQESEYIHYQPSLEPTLGPQNIALLDFKSTQTNSGKVNPDDEKTLCQEIMQGHPPEDLAENASSILNESNVFHELEEEKVVPLIMALEAVIIPEQTPIDLAGDHAQLQLEHLTEFSSTPDEKLLSSDPLQDVNIHSYTPEEIYVEIKPNQDEVKNVVIKEDREEEKKPQPFTPLLHEATAMHQVPEDTKDVKVGTLIGVLAPEGVDWKTIDIPTEEAASAPPPTAAAEDAVSASAPIGSHSNFGPSVRLLLEQYGLAASQVPHGGPHGILLKGDVLTYIKEKSLQPLPLINVAPPEVKTAAVTSTPAPSAPPPRPLPGVSEDGFEDVEVTSMRRTIAKRLSQSKMGIAHAYSTLECRSDKLMALRKQYKAEGINVSVNDLIIKAVAVALSKCPEMNCVWQGDQLTLSSQVDISVAVSTPTGLITPIVKEADALGVEDIAIKVRDLAGRARENKLKLDEFQGGTFTISNLGMFGITEFSAIINPPQCGILAVGSGIVSIDENCKPVTNMRATLSYDRAGVEDDTAAIFLETLKNLLENPVTMIVGGYTVDHPAVDHPLAALL